MAQDLTLQHFVADELARIFVKRQNSGRCAPDQPAARQSQRPALPFRAINIANRPGHDPGLQRHHLLPRQLLSRRCLGAMFEGIAREWPGLDDFRSNGMLLPCNDSAALQSGLPLHRGPHRAYNAMVIERVGEIEADWSSLRLGTPRVAQRDAIARLQRLQQDLRRRLLDPGRKRLELNRHDPLSHLVDFTELDAMVDALWSASDPWLPEPAFLVDQPAIFKSAIPLNNFTRAANPAWARSYSRARRATRSATGTTSAIAPMP